MFLSILRVLFGFALACLAAGLTKVVYAYGLDALMNGTDETITKALELTALTATHHMLFSAPFALVAAAIGEWMSIRSFLYYVLAGLAISMAGYAAIYNGEIQGQATLGNSYALTAYLTTGLIAGLTYWLFSGRKAGDAPAEPVNFSRPSGKAAPKPVAKTTVATKPSVPTSTKPANGAPGKRA
jgi:hypothetical protein